MTLLVTGATRAWRIERELRAAYFQPPPKLSVSEWADKYRVLARDVSANPGQWRTSAAPYQREIMDKLSDPRVQWVVWMKASQLGATEILTNNVGYFMDQDPSPILVVQPTIEMGRSWSTDRLDAMLRDSPRLGRLQRNGPRRERGQTILHRTFPGGHLTIVGSKSAASLAMRPIRIVFADEVDRYARSAGKEGDPLSLAVRRTATFWNRKVYVPSTPTLKGESRIEQLFDESTQHQYYVPCPHCDHYQLLRKGDRGLPYGLRWDEQHGRPVLDWTVEYLCAGCGALIDERFKPAMLARGEWRATHPERSVIGFHLNALYSPWMRWVEIVDEFYKAKVDREKLKTFVNTLLAETWEEEAEEADGSVLLARAEDYGRDPEERPIEVPAYVAFLTAGVDVQGDRLECDVWAWGRGEESALVRHEVLWGDPAKPEVWEQLVLLLQRPWRHAGGQLLTIRVACVDSGGHHTDAVYRFTRRRLGLLLWPVKGVGGPGRAPVTPPARKSKAKVKLLTIGTDALKDILFARVKVDKAGPGCIHLPAGISPLWVGQLTAERVVKRYENGRPVRRYVLPAHARNEALDMYCYALAGLLSLGEHQREQLGALVEQLARKPDEKAAEAPAPPAREGFVPRKANWMTNY